MFGRRQDKVFLKLKALLEPFGITTFYTDGWGVRPENPNQLKFLTFALAMIIFERCIVPYPLTSRDKVCDHATRRLCPPCLYLGLVPVSSRHVDRTPRLAS